MKKWIIFLISEISHKSNLKAKDLTKNVKSSRREEIMTSFRKEMSANQLLLIHIGCNKCGITPVFVD